MAPRDGIVSANEIAFNVAPYNIRFRGDCNAKIIVLIMYKYVARRSDRKKVSIVVFW